MFKHANANATIAVRTVLSQSRTLIHLFADANVISLLQLAHKNRPMLTATI